MSVKKSVSASRETPGVYTLKTFRDLADEPPTEWLIRPLMMVDSQVVMFGPPSEGKSFVALSMALSVATGLQWMGHETKRGPVIYVVAEGGKGVQKRVRAWLKEHGVEDVEGEMFFLVEAPQLRDIDDLTKLIAAVKGQAPTLIVLDTLARTMVGADENSAKNVGEWINGARELQKATGATVLTLHHTTKRKAKGENATERGSSALRGAADTMIAISKREDVITLCCGKQKDEEPFESFVLVAKTMSVGGTESDPQTSLVLGVRLSNRRDSHTASCCALRMSVAALGDGRFGVQRVPELDDGPRPIRRRADTA